MKSENHDSSIERCYDFVQNVEILVPDHSNTPEHLFLPSGVTTRY
jgi:hypothetical protein